MEQIEALLKRINAENKKTKEVLDNIQKGELNGNVKRKNSGINTLILLFYFNYFLLKITKSIFFFLF